jgi:hypothetical protein
MIRTLHSIALVLSLSYGCGGDPVSLKQAVIDRGKLLCRESFRCRETFPLSAELFTSVFGNDEATCNSKFAEVALKYEAAEKRGTLSYSEDKYQICTNHQAQFFPPQACDVFWTVTDPSPAMECDTELLGHVASGGTCVLDEECSGPNSECNGSTCVTETSPSSSLARLISLMR